MTNYKVKVTRQNYGHPRKGLDTRNTHGKYQNSSTHSSKVINKGKVFKNRSNSKVKVTGSKMVVTTESTHCSIVISKVKVFKNRSNSKVKVTWSKLMVPMERSCLIEGHMVKNNATHGKVS